MAAASPGRNARNLYEVKAGGPLSARGFNFNASVLERARLSAGPGSGIELKDGPSGVLIRQTRIAYAHPAKVTTAITAAAGLTYGQGVVTFLYDSGTALALSAITGVVVKNYHDKGAALNAVVGVAFMLEGWWLVDVDSCTHVV